MKRIVTASLATALLGVGVAPASAAAESTYNGLCSYDTFAQQTLTNGEYRGEMDVRTVVYSPVATDNPVTAMVTCRIRVNGTTVQYASFSGTTVVAGAVPVRLTIGDNDTVDICTDIDFLSDATPDVTCAQHGGDWSLPPQSVIDLANDALTATDPLVCAALRAASPGVPPAVAIDPSGDTYLNGELLWDCPPYART